MISYKKKLRFEILKKFLGIHLQCMRFVNNSDIQKRRLGLNKKKIKSIDIR